MTRGERCQEKTALKRESFREIRACMLKLCASSMQIGDLGEGFREATSAFRTVRWQWRGSRQDASKGELIQDSS